jgi:hypothetical protein
MSAKPVLKPLKAGNISPVQKGEPKLLNTKTARVIIDELLKDAHHPATKKPLGCPVFEGEQAVVLGHVSR